METNDLLQPPDLMDGGGYGYNGATFARLVYEIDRQLRPWLKIQDKNFVEESALNLSFYLNFE